MNEQNINVCPSCGFSHAWDGTYCRHCFRGTPQSPPTKSDVTDLKGRCEQIAFAVRCARRVLPLLDRFDGAGRPDFKSVLTTASQIFERALSSHRNVSIQEMEAVQAATQSACDNVISWMERPALAQHCNNPRNSVRAAACAARSVTQATRAVVRGACAFSIYRTIPSLPPDPSPEPDYERITELERKRREVAGGNRWARWGDQYDIVKELRSSILDHAAASVGYSHQAGLAVKTEMVDEMWSDFVRLRRYGRMHYEDRFWHEGKLGQDVFGSWWASEAPTWWISSAR